MLVFICHLMYPVVHGADINIVVQQIGYYSTTTHIGVVTLLIKVEASHGL